MPGNTIALSDQNRRQSNFVALWLPLKHCTITELSFHFNQYLLYSRQRFCIGWAFSDIYQLIKMLRHKVSAGTLTNTYDSFLNPLPNFFSFLHNWIFFLYQIFPLSKFFFEISSWLFVHTAKMNCPVGQCFSPNFLFLLSINCSISRRTFLRTSCTSLSGVLLQFICIKI